MNSNAVTFALAEFAFAVQLPIWLIYTREPLGALAAAAGMFVAWLLFRWSEQ